jgi:restriction system protein
MLYAFTDLLTPGRDPLPREDFPFAFGFIVPAILLFDVGWYAGEQGPPDRDSVRRSMYESFGIEGVVVADRMFDAKDVQSRLDPFLAIERYSDNEIIALGDLYDSRELIDGIFLDQRFLDFLAANVAEVPKMHWRKFEGLCATYFDREGYKVEIGPGANDDGVDLRLWPADGDESELTIVQCKREKAPIQKMVVKALWADVTAEGARRGVLATTATVAPGARRTVESRRYPIDLVERECVTNWLNELRTPGTGLDLG